MNSFRLAITIAESTLWAANSGKARGTYET